MANEENRELSLDDLEGVAGGVRRDPEFVSNDESDVCVVRCPFCGREEEMTSFQGATIRGSSVYLICGGCRSPFQYRITRKTLNSRTGVWTFEIDTAASPSERMS